LCARSLSVNNAAVPTVEMDLETSLSPERVEELILDFSDRRPQIWPRVDPDLFEVVDRGETWADIREGTKAPGLTIWAIEHYDWSVSGTIRWTVKESNFSAPGSFVQADITPRDGGGSKVHLTWSREGTSLMGKLVLGLIALLRARPIGDSFRKTFARAEAGEI
jgi:hypothetical protein